MVFLRFGFVFVLAVLLVFAALLVFTGIFAVLGVRRVVRCDLRIRIVCVVWRVLREVVLFAVRVSVGRGLLGSNRKRFAIGQPRENRILSGMARRGCRGGVRLDRREGGGGGRVWGPRGA